MESNHLINKTTDNVIWVCFALWLLVDSLNGYAMTNNINVRPSQIFKFMVFVIVTARMIQFENFKKLFICLLPYLILVLLNSYDLHVNTFDTFTLLMKPLSSFVFFLYFKYMAEKNVLYFEKKFWTVFILSFLFFIANIVLGLMGFGRHVYETGNDTTFGVKGYLYAQNEISGLIIYLYPAILYYIRNNYSRIVYYLLIVLIIFISFSIGTKTSLAIAILSGFVVTYYLGSKIEKITMVVGGVIVAIAGIVYLSYFMALEFDIVERFMYFYDQHGFVEAITSGRFDYWEERSEQFFRMDFISNWLGWGNREDFVCEMDPFDAILQFGYVGGIINSLFLLYLVMVPLCWRRKNRYAKIMMFCNISLFFVSIFSGHIFFSSMAGLFVALANAQLYYDSKKIRNYA